MSGELALSDAAPAFQNESVPALKRQLARADRRRTVTAVLMIAPLLAFLFFTFLVPIGGMLWRSVEDREVARIMPQTVAAIGSWNGKGLPDDTAYAALGADVAAAAQAGTLGQAAKRLNYDINGFRTLLATTARKLPHQAPPIPGRLSSASTGAGESPIPGPP